MLNRAVKKTIKFIALLVTAGVLSLFLSRLITSVFSITRVYNTQEVSPAPVAIVFGAGLRRDGSPTQVLRDRVSTAAQLYSMGKVKILLMSGDNRFDHYNEPLAMKSYAMSLGIPESAIVLDHAGRRTYDTCYRAKIIFGVEKAILITQQFHLPRALYTCQILGLPAVGVPADQREYRSTSLLIWNIRELLATFIALWDVHISHPIPVLGDPEPIIFYHTQ